MYNYIYTQQYKGNNPGWRPSSHVCIETDGNIIYAHTTLVPEVFANPPKEPFKLVTESGDLGLFEDGDNIRIGNIYVSNWFIKKSDIPDNLIMWFAQHANIIHPKIKALPLGIPYHDQTDRMQKMLSFVEKNGGKTGLAYLNCRIESNVNERFTAYEFGSQNKDWTVHHHPSDLKKHGFIISGSQDEIDNRFLYEVARHRFTVCPQGAGVDTYRFWETLYMGSIPIVRNNQKLTKNWNLPILEVGNWSDCTTEFLNRQYEIILARGQNQEYDLNQLNRYYWVNLIKNS